MAGPRAKAGRRVAELTEIERKALDLKIQGKSTDAIAAALGIPRSTAYDTVCRALARSDEAMAKRARSHRELEAQRLDALLAAVFPVAVGDRHVVASDPDDNPTDVAFDAQVKAIDRVAKLMERRAKLLGLDLPTRTELTGKDGGPVATTARVVILPELEPDDPVAPEPGPADAVPRVPRR